jgi:hypothetical protein
VVVDWPHRFLGGTETDSRSAICMLTHDPKFDVPLLEVALRKPASYVGAMGSRRPHDDRVERLPEAGLSDAELARMRSPIGLDIGARTPEETAVSVAAEPVQLRWGGTGTPLTATIGAFAAADGPARAGSLVIPGSGDLLAPRSPSCQGQRERYSGQSAGLSFEIKGVLVKLRIDGGNRRRFRIFWVIAALALTVSGMTAAGQPAVASTYAVYKTTSDVSARISPTAPSTSAYGAPAGASIAVQCQVIGQPVGPKNNTLYFWVAYAGRSFYVPDTWTNSPHLAGQPPIAGIPMCGSAAVPVPCWAASCTGKNPATEGCVTGNRYLGNFNAWAPNDQLAQYIEVHHSDHCGSAWLTVTLPSTSDTEGTTASIWNPGGPSYSVKDGSFTDTAMVNDVPGVTTCLGAQVYYYGSYYQWEQLKCY